MEENTQNVEKQSGKPSLVVIGAIGVAVVFVILLILWFAGRNDGAVQEAEGNAHVEAGDNAADIESAENTPATDMIVQESADNNKHGEDEQADVSVEVVVQPEPETEVILSYPDKVGLDFVEMPARRELPEVFTKLEEMALENEDIAYILENKDDYSEYLLGALAANPEMTDFVLNYNNEEREIVPGLTEQEKEEDFPLFLQWDPRWGYEPYGDANCVGIAGCGPVCLSMVLYYMTGDETLLPDVISEYSMENDYYMYGTGTKWTLFEGVGKLYGLKVTQPDISKEVMTQALESGNLIICSMGQGVFTSTGHFVVFYGYEDDKFSVNDPNCVYRSRMTWEYEEFGSQIKRIWVFEK